MQNGFHDAHVLDETNKRKFFLIIGSGKISAILGDCAAAVCELKYN